MLGTLSDLRTLRIDGTELTGCVPLNLRGKLRPYSYQGFGQSDFFHFSDLDFCVPPPPPDEESDRAALMALYNATGGRNWHFNENWGSGKPLGEWCGVTTSADGRVDSVFLFDNNLGGELPGGMKELSKLTLLDLSNNQIRGAAPDIYKGSVRF